MKKKLLICCFLFLQIISCSTGTIEYVPEATKLLIENESNVKLLNVKWKNIDFGDIETNKSSEMIVPDGNGFVGFEISNKQYNTYTSVNCEKHHRAKFTFLGTTLVTDKANPTVPISLGEL